MLVPVPAFEAIGTLIGASAGPGAVPALKYLVKVTGTWPSKKASRLPGTTRMN